MSIQAKKFYYQICIMAQYESLFMAGVYRIENGKPVFSMLTREPAENIAFIHNRMPVILHPEAKNDWLNVHYAAGDVLKSAVLTVDYLRQ